ncbi:serine hydrolase (plasmid) [Rhodococcus aetherivorans]
MAPVGGGQSLLAGPWQTGVAWSTIKVPLAIAALRESGDGTALDAARHAISASDNTAAEQLWNFLGPPPTAADKIEAVLRESGDVSTQVQSEILRSGFSSFGQTVWTLSDQAQFAAMLPCRPDAESLLELMRTTTADGGWGLATLRGTRSKGGWGPDERGRYLARQFGILDSRSGRYAVALAAEPASGALTDATAMITTLAHWVAVRAQTFPANAGC